MAKIKIKNSVTAGSAPSGLSFGEMAVNITDKKIYIGNAVEGVVTLHDQQNVVTSVNGSTGAVSNIAVTNAAQTFSGLQTFSTGVSAATIYAATVGGDEGGQVDFGNPVTNTVLSGGVAIDIYQDKMRFYEKGGSARGYYIDLSAGGAGVGTNLVGGGGAVTSVSGSGSGISVSPTTGAVVVSNTGVHSINGSTGAVTNVARINEGNTFTVRQVMNAGATMLNLNVSAGATLHGLYTKNGITLGSFYPIINSESGSLTLKATVGGILPVSPTFVLSGFDYDSGAGAASAVLTVFDATNGYGEIHLNTGSNIYGVVGITGPTTVRGNLTSTGLVSGASGMSASGGVTFTNATVYVTNSTASVDPLHVIHSSTGAVKFSTSGQGRVGAIKLGNASTINFNTFLYNTDGLFSIHNGISNTYSNMLSLTTNGLTTSNISGVTFTGLVKANSGLSAASAITGGSYIVAESGFRVGSGSINAQIDSYVLTSSDNGKVITVNAATSKTITVSSGLPVGFNCTVIRLGSGAVSFVASGTTINSVSSFVSIASQHGAASLISYTTDVFNLSGNLA